METERTSASTFKWSHELQIVGTAGILKHRLVPVQINKLHFRLELNVVGSGVRSFMLC